MASSSLDKIAESVILDRDRTSDNGCVTAVLASKPRRHDKSGGFGSNYPDVRSILGESGPPALMLFSGRSIKAARLEPDVS